ncbi:MAG: hypothetical protein GX371_06420 [Bacteroidales bacterium]|nr:hypothetical protein [Bacteroidales bacterium]
MRKLFFLLLFTLLTATMQAQENNYIRISGDLGLVANTARDKKFGAGGSIGWLTIDNLISKNPNNFLTLHLKGFNNPYGDGKLISSILNGDGDGFNYIMPLVGYRITGSGVSNGYFVEPRVGASVGAMGHTSFAFSPLAGFGYENFEFSLFCDMGFSGKNNAIRKKNFFTPGISVAYTIAIY